MTRAGGRVAAASGNLAGRSVPGVSVLLRSAGRFCYDLRIACLMICGTDGAMVVSEAGR